MVAGILLVLSGMAAAASDSSLDSSTTTSSTSSTTTTTSTTTTLVATTTTTTTTTPSSSVNPFTVRAVADYLKKRTNLVTAAVFDVRSGQTYLYQPDVHEQTASMVKIDILADLLYETQRAHRSLTTRENVLSTKMIELSNNGATNQLWTDIGGRDSLDSFNALIGFKQTFPNYAWGKIETTSRDQVQLLKTIVLPNAILTAPSRAYEMALMENVTPGQQFGLGWGSPARVNVGLKDGWYRELGAGWQINTSGYVQYKGRLYLATIMCTNNSNETYGVGTVTTLSRLIWENLKP